MRILKEETAKERKETILRWIIQEYIRIKKPIGSELVARKANLNLSSATIRNIMQTLEKEGYLHQPHTSGGRVPTDKAYRFYVNYLTEVQKFASEQKAVIEDEYQSQMDEIDKLMVQTSKTLANLSHSAGFVFTSNVYDQTVKRIDFVSLGLRSFLAVLVTDSGTVRHWPVTLPYEITPQRLRILSTFINQEISGLSLRDAQEKLHKIALIENRELKDATGLAIKFLSNVSENVQVDDDLYVDGLGQLVDSMSESQAHNFVETLRIMEDKKRFAQMLTDKLKGYKKEIKSPSSRISVTIGAENEIKELHNLSMVSCTYRIGKKTLGLLGILGPRHMQYSKMISLVANVGDLMEKTLLEWEKLMLGEESLELGFEDNEE